MLNPPKSISKLEHWNTTPVNIKIFWHPINPIPSNAFLCKMIYKIQSSEIIAKTLNRIDHKIILSRPSSKRSNRAARGTRRLVAGRMDILSLEFRAPPHSRNRSTATDSDTEYRTNRHHVTVNLLCDRHFHDCKQKLSHKLCQRGVSQLRRCDRIEVDTWNPHQQLW